MKLRILTALLPLVIGGGGLISIQAQAAPTAMPNQAGEVASITAATNFDLTNEKDKLSYTIGVDLAQNFKRQGIDLNVAAFTRGVLDYLTGSKLLLDKQVMEQTLQSFQKQLQAKREAENKELGQKNLEAEKIFLSENKNKKGVVALADGLQYKALIQGTGIKPTDNDIVTVEYSGRLLNGSVFDSTDKLGKPVSFRVADVIPGWSQILKLMNEGSTWEVYIPASLAYGEQGVTGLIGPNEMLIFNIHLLSVKRTGSQAQNANNNTQTTQAQNREGTQTQQTRINNQAD